MSVSLSKQLISQADELVRIADNISDPAVKARTKTLAMESLAKAHDAALKKLEDNEQNYANPLAALESAKKEAETVHQELVKVGNDIAEVAAVLDKVVKVLALVAKVIALVG